jgi:Tol biopolymer transport system component
VSVSSSGVQGNRRSLFPVISANGQVVAFMSRATNLVPGGTNGNAHVFVHDRTTDRTTLVSVGPGGVQADGDSANISGLIDLAIPGNGRFVAFGSRATNLVPGDTNFFRDIFVHDLVTQRTERVSVTSSGKQADEESFLPSVSADGRFVAFESVSSNLGGGGGIGHVFIRDRTTGSTTLGSIGHRGAGNSSSFYAALSADGNLVSFTSRATNLVPGDTNGFEDVFVHNRTTGTTKRVSLGAGGAQANSDAFESAISADGRFVAFDSAATNMVPGGTNGKQQVFLHDRATGTTVVASVGPRGEGNDHSFRPVISANGNFVGFQSAATNLVSGDRNRVEDVFVYNRLTGTTRRVSLTTGGKQGNKLSRYPALSADGRFVVFASNATNLVPGDTNGAPDIFVRNR